ncbi:hypothetical protein ARTHROSP310_10690 [Arthrobacter sp. AD-310]
MDGGSGAGTVAACTTKTVEALTEDVLAVTATFPDAVAGMVAPVLNDPVAVVRNWKVAAPMMTVPVAEALKPVPETVMAEPAGPLPGSSTIRAAAPGAAVAACTPDRTIPAATRRPITNVLSTRNITTHLQLTGGLAATY